MRDKGKRAFYCEFSRFFEHPRGIVTLICTYLAALLSEFAPFSRVGIRQV